MHAASQMPVVVHACCLEHAGAFLLVDRRCAQSTGVGLQLQAVVFAAVELLQVI